MLKTTRALNEKEKTRNLRRDSGKLHVIIEKSLHRAIPLEISWEKGVNEACAPTTSGTSKNYRWRCALDFALSALSLWQQTLFPSMLPYTFLFLTTHCNGVSEWLRGKFVRSNTPFYPRNSIQFKETCFLVSFLSRELNPLIWSWIWTFGFNFVLLIRDTPARRTPYWLYFTTFPETTFPGEEIRAAIRHKHFASEILR